MRLVLPEMYSGIPAVRITRSPDFTNFRWITALMDDSIISSVSAARSISSGRTPQESASRRKVSGKGVVAMTGVSGRYFAVRRAVPPVVVAQRMADALTDRAISTAAWATDSVMSGEPDRTAPNAARSGRQGSTLAATFAIILHDSTG